MTSKTILNAVATITGLTVEQIKSKCRKNEFVEARDIAAYLMWQYADMSFCKAGREINRDHSTTMHGIENVIEWNRSNIDFKRKFDLCKAEIIKYADSKVFINIKHSHHNSNEFCTQH